MRRFAIVFGIVLAVLALGNRAASARHAPAPSQTVNAVIGDESFVTRFGEQPTLDTREQLRITVHLEYVLEQLESKDVSHLSDELRFARRANIERLKTYTAEGVFPANFDYPGERRPCFVDKLGRICAAGYLIRHSTGEWLVQEINDRYQYEKILNMRSTDLTKWVSQSGLAAQEVAMIQPGYAFAEFDGEVTPSDGPAPLRMRIQGVIRGSGWGPNTIMSYTIQLPGDLLIESGPLGVADTALVDTTYEKTCPGSPLFIMTVLVDDSVFGTTSTIFLPITASPPAFSMNTGISGLSLIVSSPDLPDVRRIDMATIDWGDGGPPENFDWDPKDEDATTPFHTYAAPGDYTITVTNHYDGTFCSFDHTETIDVAVGATPVESATWGRVKAIFATSDPASRLRRE